MESKLAPIEQLPGEILTKILRHTLPADTPHAFAEPIAAIRSMSRRLLDSGREDRELQSAYSAISLLGQTVKTYVDDAASLTHEHVRGLGLVLGLLHPGRRAAVAQAAIHQVDSNSRALAIGGLGPGLAQLPQALRDDLFDAAIHLPADHDKALALGGLATGLEFLEPSRARALVNSVLALPDDAGNKGHAIAGLAPKLAQLSQAHRAGLVEAATHLADWEERTCALTAVGAQLVHLGEPEQAAVIHAVDVLPAGPVHAHIFQAMVEAANEARLDTLAQIALGGPGFGGGPDAALGLLGVRLAGLSEDRRNEVFDATLQLDAVHKCAAISWLAAGLASLTPAQQQTLAKETTHLPEDAPRGAAIGSLGAWLGQLPPDLRNALVEAGIACPSLDQKASAIAGLAQGWHQLTQSQRHALTTAAAGMEDSMPKWQAIAALAREAMRPPTA